MLIIHLLIEMLLMSMATEAQKEEHTLLVSESALFGQLMPTPFTVKRVVRGLKGETMLVSDGSFTTSP